VYCFKPNTSSTLENIKLVNLNDTQNTMQTYINNIYYKREDSFAKAKIIGLDNIGNNND